MHPLYIPFTFLAIFSYIDFWLTKLLIDTQGYEAEGSPWLRWAIECVDSTWPIFAIKTIALVIYAAVIHYVVNHKLSVPRIKVMLTIGTYAVLGIQMSVCCIGAYLILTNG